MKLVGWEQLATQGVPRWQVHKRVAGGSDACRAVQRGGLGLVRELGGNARPEQRAQHTADQAC